jgi:hypothetical protein
MGKLLLTNDVSGKTLDENPITEPKYVIIGFIRAQACLTS